MVMIDNKNISSVLSKMGVNLCVGLDGKKCFRPRRDKGRLCKECHRAYMKAYMSSKRGSSTNKVLGASTESNRANVVDGYDFNQDEQYN